MPLVALVAGIVFLVGAVRDTLKDSPDGTHKGLIHLLQGDITGPNNFLYWIAVIAILGILGAVDDLKPLSDAFLVLFVIVILLGHKGFFTQLTAALGTTQSQTPNTHTYAGLQAAS